MLAITQPAKIVAFIVIYQKTKKYQKRHPLIWDIKYLLHHMTLSTTSNGRFISLFAQWRSMLATLEAAKDMQGDSLFLVYMQHKLQRLAVNIVTLTYSQTEKGGWGRASRHIYLQQGVYHPLKSSQLCLFSSPFFIAEPQNYLR